MRNPRRYRRKGNVVVLMCVLLPVLLAMGAFAIDVGYVCYMRSQAQTAADAAGLAAVEELPGGQSSVDSVASRYALLNLPPASGAQVTAEIGTWDGNTATFAPGNWNGADAVRITVLRPNASLFFGHFLGHSHADITASAITAYEDRISGFEIKDGAPACSLMPFAVDRHVWIDKIVNGNGSDEWTYDKDNKTVGTGGDTVPELNMYPTHGVTPGNFCTVDIGKTNNASPDIERQILDGPSAADLEMHGGKLELDAETGTLMLNGETGISSGFKDALWSIRGLPRTIMLYDQVTEQGETTYYRIVGFVGITIVDSDLTTGQKHVTVQPTYVVDQNAIIGEDRGENDYVRYPAEIVR
jgi:Flp pilus assembly protein TadG